MLYMIIEHFRNQDARPVYRRFQESGRLAPDGLKYISSWVDVDFRRCFQIMETDERELLEQWMTHWSDLADFEVFPIITSPEAVARITPQL